MSHLRIAVCISGYLRTYDRTFSSYQKIFNTPNTDVFIHTWDMLGSNPSRHDIDEPICNITTNSQLDTINKLYQPKDIMVEEFNPEYFIDLTKNIEIPDQDKHWIIFNLGFNFSMFYSIMKSNDLKSKYEQENNFRYDYVIRYRSDMDIYTDILSALPLENEIFYPAATAYCEEGMSDQLAIGDSITMDKYSQCFNHAYEICDKHETTIRPEAILRKHCEKQNINVLSKSIITTLIRANTK